MTNFKKRNVQKHKSPEKMEYYQKCLEKIYADKYIIQPSDKLNIILKRNVDYQDGIDFMLFPKEEPIKREGIKCIGIDVKDFKFVRYELIPIEIWNEKGNTWLEHSKAIYFLFILPSLNKMILVDAKMLKAHVHSLGFKNGKIPKNPSRDIYQARRIEMRNNKWINLSFKEIKKYSVFMDLDIDMPYPE